MKIKKILCMLLACVLCVSTLGGCQVEYPEWVIEDFYGYDEDGNLDEEYLKEKEAANGGSFYFGRIYIDPENLYTYRGLKIGDSVDTLIEKYPVDDFELSLGGYPDVYEKRREAYEKDRKKAMKEETEKFNHIHVALSYYMYADKDDKIRPFSSKDDQQERVDEIRYNSDVEMIYHLRIYVGEGAVKAITVGQTTKDDFMQGYLN